MVKETKLYDALAIQPTATQEEIKKGYRYVPPGFIALAAVCLALYYA